MKHYKLFVALLPLLGIVSSCSDELEGNRLRPSEQLCFTASLEGNSAVLSPTTRGTAGHLSFVEEEWTLETLPTASTRATLLTSLPASAQVIGYYGSTSFQKEFTLDGNELTSAEPIYWNKITSETLTVYAYAPALQGVTSETFTYTITDADKQEDIIVAKSIVTEDGFRKAVPLNFNHALTGIRFLAGEGVEGITSISVSGVYDTGTYTIGSGWAGQTWSDSNNKPSYTTNVGDTLLVLPQTLPDGATVTVTLSDSTPQTVSLKGLKWEEGRLITYTLHAGTPPQYIYFDLAAGNVNINATSYSGKVYVAGEATEVKGNHSSDNIYYVYQSSTSTEAYDKSHTGYETESNFTNKVNCRIPNYPPVKLSDGRLWSEYITNNTSVEDVIETWDDEEKVTGVAAVTEREAFRGVAVVRDAGREGTPYWINVTGKLTCRLTIDNLYSINQNSAAAAAGKPTAEEYIWPRQDGGLAFVPKLNEKSQLTVNIIGDNRFGNVHYQNHYNTGSELIFEGTGSMTVADVNYVRGNVYGSPLGYKGNVFSSVIGSNNGTYENSYGIVINSGVIFSGSTAAENCSAIGGGGNGETTITINGGTVTAVATTTGTAIGGGIGYNNEGGGGEVTINGGNVYAYNLKNQWGIPSSAIGGSGSRYAGGQYGYVTITGGYVYAYSALGTAIGGGSSNSTYGGDAKVTITGGTIIAKSGTKNTSIGGGTGGTGYNSRDSKIVPAPGGNAEIYISGNPIIRTGSIGGGQTNDVTNDPPSKMGYATIKVEGGDTQAQFVLAAGSGGTPSFTMTAGTIRNSDTADKEYIHIVDDGGAIYVEDGTCKISGGAIKECAAVNGGAIYMTGGSCTISNKAIISDNLARGGHGGAVCILNGTFKMEGEEAQITRNSAINREGKGGNGGGVYVASNTEKTVEVTIASGIVTGNTSDRLGGGICVNMTGDNSVAKVTVGTKNGGDENPNISKNHTLLEGGGLYVKGSKADINIQSGYIMENTVSAYVANENVANEGGMVTLEGGEVTHVVVTFNANGGNETDVTQNIVTATNSLLNAPTFTRTGYTFTGWNTRADGRGTSYTNGQVMNITTDLTLYAQWKL
ncbi:MAG: fimbrillin family protein [Bacteroides sp.]|nr:fimbrillin family protein [Bacteroides sp.]